MNDLGKRSSFARRPMDDYQTTDPRAVDALVPFLMRGATFAEPCCGDFALVDRLEHEGLECVYADDLNRGHDAMAWKPHLSPFYIITNPPWTRPILHEMIIHFQRIAPTWLLFDADWAHTKQARPFMDQCSHIVAIGRLKWIPDSKFTGKDNCAWYRFDANHVGGAKFFPQMMEAA